MVKSLNEQALIAYQTGNFNEALELLTKSLSEDSQQNEVCKLIGNIYLQFNNFDNALKYFDKSFQLKKEAEILLVIINLNIKLKVIVEAKNKLISNIEILSNPINIEKLLRFLIILKLDHISHDVIKKFDFELIEDEATLELFLKIAFNYNNLNLSLKLLEKLIGLNPLNKKYIINKSIILRKLYNNEKAIDLLREYLSKVQSDDDDVKYLLSLILLHPENLIKDHKNTLIECEKLIDSIDKKNINEDYKSLIQTFSLAYLNEDPIRLINKIGDLISDKKIIKSNNKSNIKNIGIVSAYFYKHSVWDAITFGLITNLDTSKFKLFIYDTGKYNDEAFYRCIEKISINYYKGDAKSIKNKLQVDEIDILIFPEIGMDPITHSIAIDRHATLQICSWGHPITSGLKNIDFYIASEAFVSKNSKDIYNESMILIPGIGSYYPKIIDSNLPVVDTRRESEKILLCPSNVIKFTKEFINTIKVISKFNSNYSIYIFQSKEKNINDYIANEFAGFPNIIISPWLSYSDYLNILKKSYLVLDSFYFSGFNTLMQAAYFNIPFVTLKSDYFKGNFGAGINENLKLEELVASNIDDYIVIVLRILANVNYRNEIALKINEHKEKIFENKSFNIINNILIDKLNHC
jgi:protein O-GlcNAc transferase